MDVTRTCENCKFNALCGPFSQISKKLSKIRGITIEAWLGSNEASAVYNSYECADDEKLFAEINEKAILHLAAWCKMFQTDYGKAKRVKKEITFRRDSDPSEVADKFIEALDKSGIKATVTYGEDTATVILDDGKGE